MFSVLSKDKQDAITSQEISNYVESLSSSSKKQPMDALKSIYGAMHNHERNQGYVCEHGGIKKLGEILKQGDKDARLGSIRILAELSKEEKTRALMSKSGVVGDIIHVIDTSGKGKIRAFATRTLANLMEDEDKVTIRAIMKAGAVGPLVEALKSDSPIVVMEIVKILHNIAQVDKMVKKLANADIIPLLVSKIKRVDSYSNKTLEQLCSVIGKVISVKPETKFLCVENDLVSTLVDLMVSDDKSLRKTAKATLRKVVHRNASVPKVFRMLNSKHRYARKAAKEIIRHSSVLYLVQSPHYEEYQTDDSSEDEDGDFGQGGRSKHTVTNWLRAVKNNQKTRFERTPKKNTHSPQSIFVGEDDDHGDFSPRKHHDKPIGRLDRIQVSKGKLKLKGRGKFGMKHSTPTSSRQETVLPDSGETNIQVPNNNIAEKYGSKKKWMQRRKGKQKSGREEITVSHEVLGDESNSNSASSTSSYALSSSLSHRSETNEESSGDIVLGGGMIIKNVSTEKSGASDKMEEERSENENEMNSHYSKRIFNKSKSSKKNENINAESKSKKLKSHDEDSDVKQLHPKKIYSEDKENDNKPSGEVVSDNLSNGSDEKRKLKSKEKKQNQKILDKEKDTQKVKEKDEKDKSKEGRFFKRTSVRSKRTAINEIDKTPTPDGGISSAEKNGRDWGENRINRINPYLFISKLVQDDLEPSMLLMVDDELLFNTLPWIVLIIRRLTELINSPLEKTSFRMKHRCMSERWHSLVSSLIHRIQSNHSFSLFMSWLEEAGCGLGHPPLQVSFGDGKSSSSSAPSTVNSSPSSSPRSSTRTFEHVDPYGPSALALWPPKARSAISNTGNSTTTTLTSKYGISVFHLSHPRRVTRQALYTLSEHFYRLKDNQVIELVGKYKLSDPLLYTPFYANAPSVNKITIDKIFTSKARPVLLRLHHENLSHTHLPHLHAHPTNPNLQSPTRMILKRGGDMRKDLYAQTACFVFNKIWENAGFLPHDTPHVYRYLVFPLFKLASGDLMSCIQCVSDSESTQDFKWKKLKSLDEVQRNILIRTSAAGYVAGWILGLRDRHLDNMMIKDGSVFFHIDFEHILNQKTRGNDAPRIAIHKDMKKYMEELGDWDAFENLCVEAFAVLRDNCGMIIRMCCDLFSPIQGHEETVRQWLCHSLMVNNPFDKSNETIRSHVKTGASGFRIFFKNTFHSAGQNSRRSAQSRGRSASTSIPRSPSLLFTTSASPRTVVHPLVSKLQPLTLSEGEGESIVTPFSGKVSKNQKPAEKHSKNLLAGIDSPISVTTLSPRSKRHRRIKSSDNVHDDSQSQPLSDGISIRIGGKSEKHDVETDVEKKHHHGKTLIKVSDVSEEDAQPKQSSDVTEGDDSSPEHASKNSHGERHGHSHKKRKKRR